MSRRPSDETRRPAQNYPPVLRRETLDEQHREVLAFVGKFHQEKRMAPTMREIARSLRHSVEWTRLALGRLEKAGLVVCPKDPAGNILPRSIRLADSAEYAEGMTARWVAWLGDLPPNERAHLVLALRELEGNAIERAIAADSERPLSVMGGAP